MKARKDLTQGAIFPHILRMSLPILIGMSAQVLLNVVDGIYVGRLGIDASMAVLNYGFPVFYLLFAFFNGLSIGTNSVLARYIGARKEASAENALGQILWICLGIFAAAIVLYPLAMPRYLAFLHAGEETSRLTHQFLAFLFLGMPFLLISLSLGGGLRAEGNMRTLATAQMLAVFANILVAPFLIYGEFRALGLGWRGLDLGVRGAGLASTVANALAALYIVRPYLSGKTHLRWVLKPGWKDLEGVKGIFRVGTPSSVSQILIGLYIIVMTKLAAEFGDTAVAAIGIGGRLDLLAVFPSLAIMTAVLTLVGQNFGAGRHDRVQESVRAGLLTAFFGLSMLSGAVFALREPLIGMFHQDAATHASALHYLSWQCLGYGLVGINIVCSGAFQGMGRGLPFLLLTLMRLLGITLPVAYFLSRRMGEYGLHFAPVIANLVTASIALIWIFAALRSLAPAPDPGPSPAAGRS